MGFSNAGPYRIPLTQGHTARDWSPRLELSGFEPVLSHIVPWRRRSLSSIKKITGAPLKCARHPAPSHRHRAFLNSSSLPAHLPPRPRPTFCCFFNSSYSEKETLGTISNENPGIHEARGEAWECSAVRTSSPRDTAVNSFPGLSILEWRRVSLSGDDITRQSWNAQMQKAEGARGQEGVWPQYHKGSFEHSSSQGNHRDPPPPSAEGPKDTPQTSRVTFDPSEGESGKKREVMGLKCLEEKKNKQPVPVWDTLSARSMWS